MQFENGIVKIGGLTVTLQAVLVVLAGMVASLLMTLMAGYKFGLGVAVVFFIVFNILFLPYVFLHAYNVNCTLVGSCKIWSWILVVLLVISFAGNTFLFLSSKDVKMY